jgi:hypothetical protein
VLWSEDADAGEDSWCVVGCLIVSLLDGVIGRSVVDTSSGLSEHKTIMVLWQVS